MISKRLLTINLALMSTFALADDSLQFKQGEHLFRTAGGYGCSTCHGMFAQGGGNVGGNIRGATLSDINARLDNEPTMKLLSSALDTDSRESLALYLTKLGKLKLVEWTLEGKPSEVSLSVEPGDTSQLVIFNKTLESASITLTGINPKKTVTIKPYETISYEWTAQPGQFQLVYQQSKLNISAK